MRMKLDFAFLALLGVALACTVHDGEEKTAPAPNQNSAPQTGVGDKEKAEAFATEFKKSTMASCEENIADLTVDAAKRTQSSRAKPTAY